MKKFGWTTKATNVGRAGNVVVMDSSTANALVWMIAAVAWSQSRQRVTSATEPVS